MRRFLLGTADGIWAADSAQREQIGLEGERVTVIAASPEPDILYAATAGSRIYKSGNQGQSWDLQFDSGDSNDRFMSLSVSPHPPHPVFAGTWPAKIFRSLNGETWSEAEHFQNTEGSKYWCFPPPPHEPRLVSILFHYGDPKIVYATVEMGGLMKSLDGGETWKPMTHEVNRDTHVVVMHPAEPDTLYLTTGFASTFRPGVYRSRDGGESWEYRYRNMHPMYTWRICIDPVRPDVLHLVAYPYAPGDWHVPTGTGGTVLRTEDGGETWTKPHDGTHLPSVNYFPKIIPDPETPGAAIFGISPYLRPSTNPKDDLPLKYFNIDGYISPSMDPSTEQGRIIRSGPDTESWEVLLDGLPPFLDFLLLD